MNHYIQLNNMSSSTCKIWQASGIAILFVCFANVIVEIDDKENCLL